MKSVCEVLQGKFLNLTSEVICRIGESAPVGGKTRKLSVRDGDDMSEKEVTNAHDVIQRYFPALCNF